jgi:hypothetical protein
MATNLHPLFNQILSPFMETVPVIRVPLQYREDLRASYCPNCREVIDGPGRLLPTGLHEIFPAERHEVWCDLECLAEWIADYAMIIARSAEEGEADE